MPDRIRFHLDEHISGQVAPGIAPARLQRDDDGEVGLRTATDAEQLSFALIEHCVLVTRDADLLRLARAGVPHAGIAFCTTQTYTVSEIVHGLILI